MNYTFQFGVVLREFPYLIGGALISLQIAFLAFWMGAVLGLFGAVGKVYGGAAMQRAINAYCVFFMNTPALVQIFFLYYALPDVGILLTPFAAVLIGLTLNSAAYLTEILRAGVISVQPTELEAAETLGFGRWQQVRYVTLPHIARTIYAPLSNFFIWLVLGSSMAALFGVEELTGRAINISTSNLRSIETFIIVAGIYIAITLVASLALALVGRFAFRVKAKVF